MKKSIVIALALFLAIPAISFAGSATSRWDITIGGYVKFDMGYATQSVGADYDRALRESNGAWDNKDDKYGNFFMYGGETRLNFLIKGPDGWGAKTMAFIEADFRGEQAAAGNQVLNGVVPYSVNGPGSRTTTTSMVGSGVFALRHAFMKMQWENDALTIGHTWQKWGLMPSFANVLLGWNMLGSYNKGGRQPQIMWDHSFNKNFNMSFGVIAPTKEYGTTPNMATVNSFSLSKYPFFEGEVSYTSDACGKIGPWQMLFSLSGFYGWDRQVYSTNTTTATISYDDDLNKAWGAAFKAFIPIIPEKKGDKGGALALSGQVFVTQAPSWYLGPQAVGAYNRNYPPSTAVDLSPDWAYPRYMGGWGQISYWFTDKLFITGWYGYASWNYSHVYRDQSANYSNILSNTQYIVNLSYDVNPAMRFGLEWDRIQTKYANYNYGQATTSNSAAYFKNKGTLDSFRVGAWYFF